MVELNTAVDAEVFAGFIEGIDSPNEVEDYIVSYFGDTKVAHDFLKEFLNKRIELRPRVHNIAKDVGHSRETVGRSRFTEAHGGLF